MRFAKRGMETTKIQPLEILHCTGKIFCIGFQASKMGEGIEKKRPGVDFFPPWTLKGLTNYIIRHQSKYSNMTSSSQAPLITFHLCFTADFWPHMMYWEIWEPNIAAVDLYFTFWTYRTSIGVENQFWPWCHTSLLTWPVSNLICRYFTTCLWLCHRLHFHVEKLRKVFVICLVII